MAFNEAGKVEIKEEQAKFSTSELFPRELAKKLSVPAKRGESLLVNALFMREEPLGILVIETTGQEGSRENEVLDALQGQISSAIKAALLHQEVEAGWRLAEERRRLAEEANQLKSRFLSMVSHELRTPLNVISGLSENLLVELKTDEAFRKTKIMEEPHDPGTKGNQTNIPPVIGKDIQRIHSSAQHLDNLIRDVLDLAVSQVGQLRLSYENLDVIEALRPVIEMGEKLAQEKGLTWKVEQAGKVGMVSWDRTRLRQVVLNLVTNAIKFTESGGVVVRFEERRQTNNNEVVISVIDTGLGIPDDEKTLIFEEFHRSDRVTTRGYGGMGLGLAICKKLVELGKGSIGVESTGEYGGGSTFWISLPVKDQTENHFGNNHSHKVLLLSQDEHSCKICRERLTQDGYEVEAMLLNSAHSWLEVVLADPPAALMINFDPNSTAGLEVIEKINHQREIQNIPILFVKINQNENRGALYEYHTMEKPLSKEKLISVLETHGMDRNLIGRTILLVDDDEDILATHTRLLETQYVGSRVFRARNGKSALEVMEATKPDLVLLDLMMPEMSGFQVLEAMQKEEALRRIPVIILTSQKLTDIEMQQLNRGVAVVMEKGIYSLDETLEHVNSIFSMNKRLGNEARRIARRAMAYLHEHYQDMITRKELAAHVGVSEEYLSTCFRKETSLTPSSYLERYRILKAKELLGSSSLKVTEVAMEVGFQDSSYFGRIFKRETGTTPYQYRKNLNS